MFDRGRQPGSVIRLSTARHARPEIYSFGHRNIQGATLHPKSGRLWTHEHGPAGAATRSTCRSPASTTAGRSSPTGVNYGIGTKIGEGTEKPGMAQPLYYWVPRSRHRAWPSIPATASRRGTGDLFVGSLKFRLLVRW